MRKKSRKLRKIESWKIGLLVLLILVLLLIFRKQIFPAPPVPEEIPTIHQFYGEVKWPNNSYVQDRTLVFALVNENIENRTLTLNGQYGYSEKFIIENIQEGEIIEFYLNNSDYENKVQEYEFSNMELTELNLWFDICGDGFCGSDRLESCSNCAEDCGSCPSGNGGGGGGGAYYPPTPTMCNENWTCSSWSDCINGEKTRTCRDLNSCGTYENKPDEAMSCVGEEIPESEEEIPEKAFDYLVVLLVAAIVVMIVIISYLIVKAGKEKASMSKLKEKIKQRSNK